MADPTTNRDPLEQKIESLTPEQTQKALKEFRSQLDNQLAAYLNSCVHCGLCADSCHYYLTDGDPASLPAKKLDLLASVFKGEFTLVGKTMPGLVGAAKLDREMVRDWVDSFFGRCTLCGRCSLNCTVGINISQLLHMGRSILQSIDLVPPELQSTVDRAVESGNNMGIPKQEWLDTVDWLQDELRAETGDPKAALPLDKRGASILYTVNPREPKFFPLSLLAAAKIFYAAGEDWTLSSDYYDVTNYGYFNGRNETGAMISDRLWQTMKKLNVNTLVLGECGHGFAANRWEAPEWLRQSPEFNIRSILQVVSDYLRDGRIKLDRSRIDRTVTLHDPCNLVRLGGIIEEQRFILKQAVTNFVEMYPNREKNFCCGGGGGQLSMTRYVARRLKAGRIKADQIAATGAKIVVAPCHNCIDQLSELNREYKLGVDIKSVAEIVADALVLSPKSA